MNNKELTVDNDKVEAAYAKLQANPDLFDPVKDALGDMFAKINMELNRPEQLTFLRWLFDNRSPRELESSPTVHPFWVPPPTC